MLNPGHYEGLQAMRDAGSWDPTEIGGQARRRQFRYDAYVRLFDEPEGAGA